MKSPPAWLSNALPHHTKFECEIDGSTPDVGALTNGRINHFKLTGDHHAASRIGYRSCDDRDACDQRSRVHPGVSQLELWQSYEPRSSVLWRALPWPTMT
jgi:hypothetical protein